MITGFNTDVEYDGIVYHVQTEDKGLDSPLILSLIYAGGAILASKRTPYDDLIASGFDEKVLAGRLQRQHKLLCAAVRAGRIEDLKRMSQRDAAARATPKPAPVKEKRAETPPPAEPPQPSPAPSTPSQAAPPPTASEKPLRTLFRSKKSEPKKESLPVQTSAAPPTVRAVSQNVIADFARTQSAGSNALHLSLLDEKEYRGGDQVTLRVRVGRGVDGTDAIPAASVTVKVLGSTFRPLIIQTKTGKDGVATVRTELPHFKTGRAAILIQVVAGGYEAELRRIIHQG